MTHKYWLSLDNKDEDTEEIKNYLLNEGLVVRISPLSVSIDPPEEVIIVEVPNKRKFEQYLKKRNKNRLLDDPRKVIMSWSYKPDAGKVYSSSKAGRLASARIKKFKEGKRKQRKE